MFANSSDLQAIFDRIEAGKRLSQKDLRSQQVSEKGQRSSANIPQGSGVVDERLRAIAHSMDLLIPGLYIWLGAIKLRIGGSLPEATYPGTIHNSAGIALVLPRYRIYTTYHGSYDPR